MPGRSSFESNLFTFKSKQANRVASACLVGGLCVGVLLGIASVVYSGIGHWMLGVWSDDIGSPYHPIRRWIMLVVVFVVYVLWHWFRPIVCYTIAFGLLGMGIGFIAGIFIDKTAKK